MEMTTANKILKTLPGVEKSWFRNPTEWAKFVKMGRQKAVKITHNPVYETNPTDPAETWHFADNSKIRIENPRQYFYRGEAY